MLNKKVHLYIFNLQFIFDKYKYYYLKWIQSYKFMKNTKYKCSINKYWNNILSYKV